LEQADSQHAAASERFDQTYAESSKSVKSVLASTSTFLSSGILDDVPTGITPKKKTWNVPQSWERTEPREALLEAFRRRKVDSDDIEETGTSPIPSSPEEELPKVASVESIPSVTSLPVIKMRKPTGKMEKLDLSGGAKEERVVVPLGESLENIPVPRRVRR
jgi:kinesin family protein 11